MNLNGEVLEEAEQFKYLGSQTGREGVEADVSFRVGEARRAAGTLRKLRKNGGLGVEIKMLYEGIIVPTALNSTGGGGGFCYRGRIC